MKRWISCCLMLATLLSLFSSMVCGASSASADEEKTITKAITASSVSVPDYAGGTSSGWMTYDCGETVTFHDTGVTSKMRIVTGTSASQFNTYCNKLVSNGYTRIYNKTVPAQSGSNLYGKFRSKDGSHSIYTYFTAAYSQTRIIVDTQSHTVEGFKYDGQGSLPTEVYMYSLAAEESGWGLTDDRRTMYLDNAGSFYIIRMPDNSLFVIDGGSHNQMSERDMEKIYTFCREITGIPEGERMTICAWFITHGDTDHYRGFTRFIQGYHKDFDIKNVIYNFEIDNGTSYHFRRVTRHFPNVRYYKPHTGEQFSVAGVTFDVLYTTEDRYTPSSSNTLTPHDSSCILDDYYNYNNTSPVLRMTFEGKTMLLTGDIFKADAILMKMYPASALKADVLQIPHHGFDNHTTLAKTVSPQIIFLNQTESAVLNRERLYNNNEGWKAYCKEIYYGGSEIVGYRADSGVFYRREFDGSTETLGWSAIVYHVGEENYHDGTDPVKNPETYYRYSQATELTATDRTYMIVDDKLNKVLAYDNNNDSTGSAGYALYDGEYFFISSARRRIVNWLISARSTVANADAAVTGSTTYHGGVPIRKGTGDYWGSGTKNSGVYLGVDNSYSTVGLHGAWSSFTDQLYAESKATWVDAMDDGTFLIYRHGNGTYYPLYRDGDVSTQKGWGCTKLTKAQVNSRIDNLKLRLYVYEETPSDMYLSWTGHEDYYVEKGVPRKDILGHITSDLRVNYSFSSFEGGGEIEYDANYEAFGTKTQGRYWLEFTKAYDQNTVGDYPVQIMYTNSVGTTVTVGELTIHIYQRNIAEEPDLQQLYFDFADTDADRDRYELNSQYQEVNFDGSYRWKVTEDDADLGTSTYFQPVVDNETGTLTATITNKSSTNRALYIQPFAPTLYPLNYNPAYAQTVQIRFKMENLKACDGQNPFFRLWYYKGSDNVRKYDRNVLMGTDFVADGEYITFSFDLYDATEITGLPAGGSKPDTTFANAGKITGLRLGFHGFVLEDTSKTGSITIDYVYIGPKASAPDDVDENIKIQHSLNLASDISINYAVKKELLADYDDFYMECELPIYEKNVLTGTRTEQILPVLKGDYYYFTLEGLNAVSMNNVVCATLHLTKGGRKVQSETDVYSIATYAYTQLSREGGSDKLKALCANLLRYGAVTQLYKEYCTDRLPDMDLTEAQKAYLVDLNTVEFGSENRVMNDLPNPVISWAGKALALDSKVTLRFIFNASDYEGDPTALQLKVRYENTQGETVTTLLAGAELYQAEKSRYSFDFDGLLAAELRSTVSVAIYDGEMQLSPTLEYSAATYGKGKSGALLAVCRALMAYSDMAKAFFAG